MSALRTFGAPGERVETGPVQFGEDWPGVFIRGDDAFRFAHALRHVLYDSSDADGYQFFLQVACGLVDDLEACDVQKLKAAEPYEPSRYVCPNCESHNVSTRAELQGFQYGIVGEGVELKALVRVFTCADCHDQWTAHDAEEARTAAVAEYERSRAKPSTNSVAHYLHSFTQATVLPSVSETLLLVMSAKREIDRLQEIIDARPKP